jgi:nitrite reductase/ring-hydroxylating ferredoxin subunit
MSGDLDTEPIDSDVRERPDGSYAVADAGTMDDGDRVIADIDGREIGVFRIDGEYYAYPNVCQHQQGPLCEGAVTGTVDADFDRDSLDLNIDWTDEGEVLSCPWHGWEYHLRSGQCLSRPDMKLPSYPVEERDGVVVVSL